MKIDFKPKPVKALNLRQRIRQYWHLHSLAAILGLVVLTILLVETEETQASHTRTNTDTLVESSVAAPLKDFDTYTLRRPDGETLLPAAVQKESKPQKAETADWQGLVVKRGYNLALLAKEAGIRAADIYFLMRAGDATRALKTLYPGEMIKVNLLPDGKLLGLQFDRDQQRLSIERENPITEAVPKFKASLVDRPLEVRYTHATGQIRYSLFGSAKDAGLSNQLTMQLAYIFGWDIDFTMDVQRGDRFTVIYETFYRDGIKKEDGEIVAAEFVNRGKSHRAVRFTDASGRTDYFSPDGGSVRKAFLRNPVDFMRISSRFNLKRKHPVLHRVRAHKGVDYAAKRGTPIKAAGEGKVVFRGKKGGYGNVVIIQHGQKYSTLYAHMSRFGSKARKGRRVKQGQVIGYVGQSGLATGPHLHYEFRVNGVHRNPLTVKHPSAKPIASQYLSDFQQTTKTLLSQLDVLGQSYFVAQQ